MNIYKHIFSALEKAKIAYLIVGGVAVNLYGYQRFTGDIDIILLLDAENLKKVDKAMEDLGYIGRQPVSIQELGDKKKLEQFVTEKGLKAYSFMSSENPPIVLDIIIDESRHFSKFARKKSLIQVWDMILPVISIDDLIGMKKKAGRDKDLIDLEALLKLKE